MPTLPIPRTWVALGVARRTYPLLILRATAVQAAMAADPTLFSSANPAPAVFATQIQALAAAQQRTIAKMPGASADRNAAAAVVFSSLEKLRSYVQGLCDESPEKAAQIVAASAMKAVSPTPFHKPILAARRGVSSGSVVLGVNKLALVGKTRAMCTYHWEYSVDAQKTWVLARSTPVVALTLTGFAALSTVSFRVRVTTRKVTGPYCQPVSIIVH